MEILYSGSTTIVEVPTHKTEIKMTNGVTITFTKAYYPVKLLLR